MNRVKLWVYALLVVAALAATLREHSRQLHAAALADIDARLSAASSHLALTERALSRETSAAATLAARDPALVEALHAREAAPAPLPRKRGRSEPPPAPSVDAAAQEAAIQAAARAALASAEATLGFELPGATTTIAANREWLSRKDAAAVDAEAEAMAFLSAAVNGETRRGYVRMAGGLWHAAAAPAGEAAGLVVLVPLDAAWAKAVQGGSGVDVTLSVPDVKPLSTGRAVDAADLVKAALGSIGTIVDAGTLAPFDLGVEVVKIPNAPLLFADAPAHRAQAIPLQGVKRGLAVLSVATSPALAPIVKLQWAGLAGLAVFLVLGLLFGFLVKPSEVAAQVPEELVAVATKIERGDFSARAPALAGKLGTLAAALNKAAEAGEANASGPRDGKPSLTDEFFSGAIKPPPEPEPGAFEFPPRPAAAAPAFADEPFPVPPSAPPAAPAREDTGGLFGGAFEAAPVPAAAASSVASAPELLQGAARTAAPVDDEESHFRQIFDDFVRMRTQCGESADGLTYEKFRQKLESNKATLVTKYGCRTVRFQVYVKEGKAALKATPVK